MNYELCILSDQRHRSFQENGSADIIFGLHHPYKYGAALQPVTDAAIPAFFVLCGNENPFALAVINTEVI